MDRSPLRDIIVGLFVLVGLGAIAWLSFSIGGFAQTKGGLVVTADFDDTGFLALHAPVLIAGVRVGEVSDITLDHKHFRAHVTMNLDPTLQLSTDTFASIITNGVLGDRLIYLKPGGEDQNLKSGDAITHTESAMVLEHILSQIVYGITKDNSSSAPKSPASATGPAKSP